MKKLLLLLSGVLIISFLSTAAFCGEGVYVAAGVGAASLGDPDVTDSTAPGVKLEFETDAGIAAYLALGYEFSNHIRLEGDISYQVNDYDNTVYSGSAVNLSGDMSCLAFLVNACYDFKNKSAFTPFITVGAGMAKVDTAEFNIAGSGVSATSDSDTVFAYQAGAGVSYQIGKKTAIDLKYRYFATDDPNFDTAESEFASHNIYIGTRLSF